MEYPVEIARSPVFKKFHSWRYTNIGTKLTSLVHAQDTGLLYIVL